MRSRFSYRHPLSPYRPSYTDQRACPELARFQSVPMLSPMILGGLNRRRWLALVMLGSLVSARLLVLVCPIKHHGESAAHAQSSGHTEHHAPATVAETEDGQQSSPHGDETNCAMLLTCTAPALIGPSLSLFTLLPEFDLRARVKTQPNADPLSATQTPPPRLG